MAAITTDEIIAHARSGEPYFVWMMKINPEIDTHLTDVGGILRVSTLGFKDGTNRFYNQIQSITNIGDRLPTTLIGGPNNGSGNVNISLIDLPDIIYDGVLQTDWHKANAILRVGFRGTSWADAYTVYTGFVANESNNKKSLKFRFAGVQQNLDELVTGELANDTFAEHYENGKNVVGYQPVLPCDVYRNNGTEWEYTFCSGFASALNQVAVDGEDITDSITLLTPISGSTKELNRFKIDSSITTDWSSGKYKGTLNGATWYSAIALGFDGVNDYVKFNDVKEISRISSGGIGCWFRPNSVASDQGIISRDSSDFDGGGHFTLSIQGSSGKLQFRMQDGSNSYTIYSNAAIPTTSGTWVVCTFGTDGMKMYLNGSATAETDTDAHTGGITGNTEPLVLGASQRISDDNIETPLTDYFAGRMNNIVIFNGDVTTTQISDHAAQTLLDDESLFLVVCDEGSGTTVSAEQDNFPSKTVTASIVGATALTVGTAKDAEMSGTHTVSATTITLKSAGTGTIIAGDWIRIGANLEAYEVVTGDANVSNGGTITITPGLYISGADGDSVTVMDRRYNPLQMLKDAMTQYDSKVIDIANGNWELGSGGWDMQAGSTAWSSQNWNSGAAIYYDGSETWKQLIDRIIEGAGFGYDFDRFGYIRFSRMRSEFYPGRENPSVPIEIHINDSRADGSNWSRKRAQKTKNVFVTYLTYPYGVSTKLDMALENPARGELEYGDEIHLTSNLVRKSDVNRMALEAATPHGSWDYLLNNAPIALGLTRGQAVKVFGDDDYLSSTGQWGYVTFVGVGQDYKLEIRV